MASSARGKLRRGYEDTSGTVARMVPTLFLTCISVVILGGTDDRVLLSGGEVSTPFVGTTRYEIFMAIAPISIIVLRIYIELQLRHLRRLKRIMTRYNVRGPVKLSADNHIALAIAGLAAVHIMPVVTIGFLGRHASAVYPDYALLLYVLAALLAIWSGWSLFDKGRPAQAIAAVALPVIMIGVGAALLHNRVIAATGAFGGHTDCSYSEERPYAAFAANYFRPVDVEKQQFPDQKAQRKHMVCGNLNETNWTRADMREALLIGADMRAAVFTDANVAGAIFEFALLRDADMSAVNAFESRFHRADLSRARLIGAELRETKFVEGILGRTEFDGARIGHATFWKADLDAADFTGAEIRY